jgi:hypothetical protein
MRESNHYIVFRIGADTDIKNGLITMVEKTLKIMEAKEDYIACQAIYDALTCQSIPSEELEWQPA